MGVSTGVDETVFVRGKPVSYGELPAGYLQYQANKQNTGLVSGGSPGGSLSQKWSVTYNGTFHDGSFAVDSDALYVGADLYDTGGIDGTTYDGSVAAIDPSDGSVIWKTEGLFCRGGTVIDDSRVYVGTNSNSTDHPNSIVALNRDDGSIAWAYSTGDVVYGTPALDENGNLYGTSYSSSPGVFKLSASDGTEQWAKSTDGTRTSPTYHDGVLYYGDYGGNLNALDVSDGSPIWTHSFSNYVHSVPGVDGNGQVYAADEGANYRAIDANDGSQVWEYSHPTNAQYKSGMAYYDGVIYTGTENQYAIAIDAADGSLLWETSTGGHHSVTPVIGTDGVGYWASNDGLLYALNLSDGSQADSFDSGGQFFMAATVKDGVLYAAPRSQATIYVFE